MAHKIDFDNGRPTTPEAEEDDKADEDEPLAARLTKKRNADT